MPRPREKNITADAFSCRTDSPRTTTVPQSIQQADTVDMNHLLPGYSDNLGPPTWVSPPTGTVSAVNGSLSVSTYSSPTWSEVESSEILEGLLQGNILATIANINAYTQLTPPTNHHNPAVLTWKRLEAACLACDEYKLIHKTIQGGVSDKKEDWDQQINDYYPHRHSLVTTGSVILLHDCPVIPKSLRNDDLEHLHAGDASATSMFERASTSLYWPNFRADMINHRAACPTCTKYAPSNLAIPPTEPEHPTYPFQSICMDFFSVTPNNYLAVVDRYSNWLSIFQLAKDTSEEVIKVLRLYISTFGIVSTITSDGAKVFTSKQMEDFCDRWGIIHRVSTAYNPRANKRAEVAVKSAKRLVRRNVSQTGSLNTDNLARALLAHRNTPCPITGLSPAQVVFGRVLMDFLPLHSGKFQPRPEWRQQLLMPNVMFSRQNNWHMAVNSSLLSKKVIMW